MGLYRSFVVITLFVTLFLRVIYLAEGKKQNLVGFMAIVWEFYSHFFVNIGMVVGVFQQLSTIPFFSYGGSGLWGFTFCCLYS
jgi:rod shape determining protein RodA